jgi:hypothetical protein
MLLCCWPPDVPRLTLIWWAKSPRSSLVFALPYNSSHVLFELNIISSTNGFLPRLTYLTTHLTHLVLHSVYGFQIENVLFAHVKCQTKRRQFFDFTIIRTDMWGWLNTNWNQCYERKIFLSYSSHHIYIFNFITKSVNTVLIA